MEQFRKILISFLNGEASAEQVQSALAALVLSDPALTQPCVKQLNHLYSNRRLTPQHYSMFRDSLTKPNDMGDASVDPLKAFDAADSSLSDPADPASPPAADDDAGKTQFRMPGAAETPQGSPGETQFRTPTTGATGYPTGATGTGTGYPTGATGTGSSWDSPSRWTGGAGGGAQGPLTIGSVIKDRFVLEELIGKGGMGMVYKARDLRKEEAQDRFPYVALKVLNEEFKQHPESLKALQRESRKAQDLAHPNIVNVFDFDRDHGNVFMTMELLEGTPLDILVRKNKGVGIPWKEALPMIKGMSLALDYAHRKNIIHSDFKPGNCFLTKDGSVKVFDFGIARAAKRTGELKGEETKFDAGTLGALTPAYATCEMIDGEEPDVRDDIYALACSIYELLSGRHPFDKLSASDATKKGLVPKPIKGLSRSRFKALSRGLALTREQRTKTAFQLLEELNPRSSNTALKVGLGGAVVLGLVVLGLVVVPGYFYNKKIENLRAGLDSEQFEEVSTILALLDEIKPDDRQLLLNSASDQVIGAFDTQVGKVFNRELDLYNYPQARTLIDQLTELYPDSSRVSSINEQVERDRQELQAQLSADYDGFISTRQFLRGDGKNDDIYDLRAIVAQIDPGDQLLSDARLPQALAAEARNSAANQDFVTAEQYYTIGLELAPEDADLINVRDEVEGKRIAVERAAEISELETRLQALGNRRVTLDQFEAVQSQQDLRALAALQPDNPVLASARKNAESLLAGVVQSDLKSRMWSRAAERISAYDGIVSENFVTQQNAVIDEQRSAHEDVIAALTARIDAAIAASRLDTPAANSAMNLLQQLEDAGANADTLSASRDRISSGYLDAARSERSKQDWEAARSLAAKAAELNPSASIARQADEEIAKVANQETVAEQELVAQEIQGLKSRFDDRLSRDAFAKADIEAGLRVLQELQEKFGAQPDVEQFVIQSRERLARRIADQSMSLAQAANWEEAVALLTAGDTGLGRRDVLQQTRSQVGELQRQQASQALQEKIRSSEEALARLLRTAEPDNTWKVEFDRQVSALEKLESGNAFVVEARERAAGIYLQKARALREQSRWVVARQQLDYAQELAPALASVQAEARAFSEGQAEYEQELAQAKTQAEIDARRETFTRQLNAGRIDRAETALADLRKLLAADDPFVTTVAPKALVDGRIRVAADNARLDQYTKAIAQLEVAQRYGSNDPRIAQLRAQYEDQRAVFNAVSSGNADEVGALTATLTRLQALMKNEYAGFAQKTERMMKRRIEDRAQSNRANAEQLYSAAKTPFPTLNINWPAAAVTTRPAPVVAATPQPAPVRQQAAVPVTQQPKVVRRPVGGGRDCRTSNAGQSNRTCYDALVGGERGPILLVVPGIAGGPPFAISRSEVSIKEFNIYCEQSGQCSPLPGKGTLPVTNIDSAQIQSFATWLSSATGNQYALPSIEQWQHAAKGGNGSLDPNINCVRNVGGRQADGFELVPVTTGGNDRANAWGLRQVVGNAEEVVVQGGSFVAAGGAYIDRVSDCTVEFTRPFNGASATAGFRLVRNVN